MSNERKIVIAELICRALADLRNPNGSTDTQIREYIENEYKIPDIAIRSCITKALQTGVEFGLINKKRAKYQLSQLVDNIQVITQFRHKAKKTKAPVRRTRTSTICKTRANRRVRRPKNICSLPNQYKCSDYDSIFAENQNYDEEFDDNFDDNDNDENMQDDKDNVSDNVEKSHKDSQEKKEEGDKQSKSLSDKNSADDQQDARTDDNDEDDGGDYDASDESNDVVDYE